MIIVNQVNAAEIIHGIYETNERLAHENAQLKDFLQDAIKDLKEHTKFPYVLSGRVSIWERYLDALKESSRCK